MAQIQSSSATYQVFTNVTTNIDGTWKNFITPVAFPNQTGSFKAKVPEYVFYQLSNGSVITGVFHNWKVLGVASLNSTLTSGISITLENQPAILIANYSVLNANATLSVKTNYPGIFVLSIDGITYFIKGNKQIQVPAGFINATVETLQGDDISQESKVIIKYYIIIIICNTRLQQLKLHLPYYLSHLTANRRFMWSILMIITTMKFI